MQNVVLKVVYARGAFLAALDDALETHADGDCVVGAVQNGGDVLAKAGKVEGGEEAEGAHVEGDEGGDARGKVAVEDVEDEAVAAETDDEVDLGRFVAVAGELEGGLGGGLGGGAHGAGAGGCEGEDGGIDGNEHVGKRLQVGEQLGEGGAGALGVVRRRDEDEARHVIPADGHTATARLVVEHGRRVALDVRVAVVVVRSDAHMAGARHGRGRCARHGRRQRGAGRLWSLATPAVLKPRYLHSMRVSLPFAAAALRVRLM